MHGIISDLPSDRLSRTLTVDELKGARAVSALDVAQGSARPDWPDLTRLTLASANLFGGFSPEMTAALEALPPGLARGAALHAVFFGGMTRAEGETARRCAHAHAARLGLSGCAVSLRAATYDDVPTPAPENAAPRRAAWLLGASGRDGAAAARAMREISRLSRLHGAHALACGDGPLTDADKAALGGADAVVLGFSLYRDHIPAYMLAHLRALAAARGASRPRHLYAVVCGAHDAGAGALALERLSHAALRLGMVWGQGLVILPPLLPCVSGGIARPLRARLEALAALVMRGAHGGNALAARRLPAFGWRRPSAPARPLCSPALLRAE